MAAERTGDAIDGHDQHDKEPEPQAVATELCSHSARIYAAMARENQGHTTPHAALRNSDAAVTYGAQSAHRTNPLGISGAADDHPQICCVATDLLSLRRHAQASPPEGEIEDFHGLQHDQTPANPPTPERRSSPKIAVSVARKRVRSRSRRLPACTSDSDVETPTMRSGGRLDPLGRKGGAKKSTGLNKGIYHKELANAYEAQLGLDPFRKFLRSAGQPDLDDQQSQYYLGLFRYIVGKPGDKEAALEMATRAIDRVVLKIFQEKLPEDLLHSVLNFDISDYRDPEDEHMRSVLTTREYVTQMMIIGYQRLHEAEGDPERSRLGVYRKKSRRGGSLCAWEARLTQAGIKSFSTYRTIEEAQEAYDLGIILIYGTQKRLNNLLTTYYAHGKFLPHISIPEPVAASVALHIESLGTSDELCNTSKSISMMERICGYFGVQAALPPVFQQYPARVAASHNYLQSVNAKTCTEDGV